MRNAGETGDARKAVPHRRHLAQIDRRPFPDGESCIERWSSAPGQLEFSWKATNVEDDNRSSKVSLEDSPKELDVRRRSISDKEDCHGAGYLSIASAVPGRDHLA